MFSLKIEATSIFLFALFTIASSELTGKEISALVSDYMNISMKALDITFDILYEQGVQGFVSKEDFQRFRESSKKYIDKLRLVLEKLETNKVKKSDKHYVAIKTIMDGMIDLQDIESVPIDQAVQRLKDFNIKARDMFDCFSKYEDKSFTK
uniref:Uncharacterized protein n=1 Tax=Clastoptera arizonana TaxID=38151 RepID=A0A1B6D128_9HEMI